MSNKEQKAKIVKNLHTAMDKAGKFVRKIGPFVGLLVVGTVVAGNKNKSNKV